MADTMLSFANSNLANTFLSKDELRAKCAMAFKTIPTNPAVSDRYVQANTETVIDDLAKLGWYPVDAKQCRQKRNSSGIRSFHMVAFQNPNVSIVKNDGSEEVECYPRIILTNSHDGFNSFKFMVGLFRLVCSNGLVIATDKMVDMSIRHINYTFEELRKQVAIAIEQVEIQAGVMSEMNKVQLNDAQKRALAESAIRIRKGIPADEKYQIAEASIEEILSPKRKEDSGSSLWNVFNVIQENMMKGGYTITNPNGKVRKQRPITSVVKSLDINKELFRSAAQFLEAA